MRVEIVEQVARELALPVFTYKYKEDQLDFYTCNVRVEWSVYCNDQKITIFKEYTTRRTATDGYLNKIHSVYGMSISAVIYKRLGDDESIITQKEFNEQFAKCQAYIGGYY